MQATRPTNLRARQPPGLLGGGCLLLLYLFSATPFAPVAFSLLAGLDRSHHVAIQLTSMGPQVALRHDRPDSTTHRHGMVARALTVFAQRTAAQQSDHVIQFGALDIAQQAPTLAIEPASNLQDPDGNLAGCPGFHAGAVTWELAASPRPPPGMSGLLLTIRSTVLLI